ncbi:hypothetical protein K7X08_017888 [Anisodus acutangulus]|uniref:Uncharacterized protein n=1 Tax=Anisodus acutangulus TaxID=402998 RepID=A0A9Q1LYM8_9SOLA|nr:hypothetical protein K7X08_017888 [Anisodus acutangulus]
MRAPLNMCLLSVTLITVIWTPLLGCLNQHLELVLVFLGRSTGQKAQLVGVRAARAPEPDGISTGTPSYGKNPGSRRKKFTASAATSQPSDIDVISDDALETPDNVPEEPKDLSSDLKKSNGLGGRGGVLMFETVFLKAMAETGQVKLYGEHPTLTETALYRARKHIYKEERLQAEKEKMEKIGPIAYYSEWVVAWKRDTSREAIQKHFEETGEDENTQLIEMFCHQTDREYRIMMGTDIRIPRDPLAMKIREDQIKQIWGGDPVYPTINYIQDLDEVVDYRGPDFHEPTPNMLAYLKEFKLIAECCYMLRLLSKATELVMDFMFKQMEMIAGEIQTNVSSNLDGYPKPNGINANVAKSAQIQWKQRIHHGKIISREELEKFLKVLSSLQQVAEIDEAMARAVDIGENDDEEEGSEAEGEEENEKITRNWSVLKNNPELRKSKGKPKKKGMSLEEAVDDSENLTDFLMDFDEDEENGFVKMASGGTHFVKLQTLSGIESDEDLVKQLRSLTSLRKLYIGKITQANSEDFRQSLERMSNLRSLTVLKDPFPILGKLPSLAILTLASSAYISSNVNVPPGGFPKAQTVEDSWHGKLE